jgi:hypothetical protein
MTDPELGIASGRENPGLLRTGQFALTGEAGSRWASDGRTNLLHGHHAGFGPRDARGEITRSIYGKSRGS